MLVFFIINVLEWQKNIRFFCGDESRFGLKTITGKRITQRGVKPVGKVQWTFKATYLYGIIEPATGESFFYEFTHCDTDSFQIFLELVSQEYPEDMIIIQLDNAGWHRAKRLKPPENIVLMFQPPHCPELNPIEQVWQYLKKRLRWQLPDTLDDLRLLIREQLLMLEKETVASIAGRKSILEALSMLNLI